MTTKEIQLALKKHGYDIAADGIPGPSTTTALKDFQKKHGLTVDGSVGPNTSKALSDSVIVEVKPIINPSASIKPKNKMMSTAEISAHYGQPGPDNLVLLDIPYPMRIAWDLKTTTNRVQIHKLVAPNLKAVFDQLLITYGLDQIRKLDIDLFGGSYNFRKMRGGSEWSRHSWGIAIDLSPEKNPLKSSNKTAQFAKPEYKKMIEIFYQNDFVGLGPEENRDWMHFQIGH